MNEVAMPAVVAITDPAWSDDHIAARARRMLSAVPRASVGIQVRDRARSASQVLVLARRLREICAESGAPIYVNDRLDIALAIDTDGMHLGQASVSVADARTLLAPGAFVSVAAHEPDEVERAARSGANAALVSPIFETPGKGPARSPSLLAGARERARGLFLYALGGIDATNAEACISAGADGVAVIRAVWQASDPGALAMALVAAVRKHARARKDER
jgi:thiamine-phosphate pyrophosphorylase